MSMTNEELSTLEESLSRLTEALGNHNSARQSITDSQQRSKKEIAKSKEATSAIIKATQREFGWLLVSMKEQNGKIEKYGESFESLGESVNSTLSKFGPIGKIVGTTIKLVTAITSSAAEQYDKILESYDALADHGMALGVGTSTLLSLANDAGYSSSSLDDLVKSTKILGSNSTSLGTSAGTGAMAFFQFAQTTDTVLAEFNKLGVSQSELTSLQAEYINQQALIGMKINANDKAAKKESYGFVDNLLLLTALTGKSKSELLEQQAANRRDVGFQITLNTLRSKGDDLTAQRLDNAATLSNEFGESYSAGVRDFINTMTATTEDGRKLILVTNGRVFDWTAQLKRGDLDEVKFNKLIASSINSYTAMLGGYETLGNTSKDNLDALGVDTIAISGAAKILNMSDKESARRRIEVAKTKEDTVKDTQNTQLLAERKIKISKDRLLDIVSGPVNSTISAFATTVKSMVVGALSFAEFFGFKGTEDILNYITEPDKLEASKKDMEETALSLNDQINASVDKIEHLKSLRNDPKNQPRYRHIDAAIISAEKELAQYKDKLATVELSRLKKEAAIKNKKKEEGILDVPLEQSSNINPAKAQNILDFIGKYESKGNYNILNGGKTAPLDTMTVAEVLELQKTLPYGNRSSAVGKYQIKRSTLQMLLKFGTVSLNDKFDKTTQDRLGMRLLEHRGYNKFVSSGNVEVFADNLASEWAALPLSDGNSRYGGVGNNKALMSRKEFISALKAKNGGIFNGPTSGYKLELHGTEAVVPMNNRRKISMSLMGNDTGPTQLEKSFSLLENFSSKNIDSLNFNAEFPSITYNKKPILEQSPDIIVSSINSMSVNMNKSISLQTSSQLVNLKNLSEKLKKLNNITAKPKNKISPVVAPDIIEVEDNDQTIEVNMVYSVVEKLKLLINEVEESTATQQRLKQYKMA